VAQQAEIGSSTASYFYTLAESRTLDFDEENPAEVQAARKVFDSAIGQLRQKYPVVLLDFAKLYTATQARGVHTFDLNDISRFHDLILLPPVSSPPYPLFTVTELPQKEEKEYVVSEGFNADIRRLSDQYSRDVVIAINYGTSEEVDREYADRVDDLVFLLVDRRHNIHARLLPLISNQQSRAVLRNYRSPWVYQINSSRIIDLTPEAPVRLAQTIGQALDPTAPEKIRVVISPYGSGKTYLLNQLAAKKLPGIGHISGAQPLTEQADALTNQVIFVDEATVFTGDDMRILLAEADKGKVIVLFYPHQEALIKAETEGLSSIPHTVNVNQP